MDQRSTSIGAGRGTVLDDATDGTRPFPGFPGEAAARAEPGASSSPGCPEEAAAGSKGDGLAGELLETRSAEGRGAGAGLGGSGISASPDAKGEGFAGDLLGARNAEGREAGEGLCILTSREEAPGTEGAGELASKGAPRG